MACQDWHPPGSTAAPTPTSPVSLWAHGAALLFRGQAVWTHVCRLTGHHLQCGSIQELRADTESLSHSPILLVPLKLAPGPKITAGKLGPWDHRPAPSPCASYPPPGRGTAERPCTHSRFQAQICPSSVGGPGKITATPMACFLICMGR